MRPGARERNRMTESVLPERTDPGNARDLPGAVSRVFGDLRGRLDGDLAAVAFGSDGAAWTVEDSGILRNWDPDTGSQIDSVPLTEAETCWAFSADGLRLASGSHGIAVWDVPTASLVARLNDSSWMLSLAFSPDGKFIASGHDDQAVRLWSVETGKLLHTLRGHSDEVCALSFSADGKRLASASEDLQVIVWDVVAGKKQMVLEGHTDRVDAIAWSRSGHRIATAGWDTSVRVWNGADGELLAMLNGQGECVHSVVFLPDGKRLACGDSDSIVRVWEYDTLKVIHELRGHRGPVKAIAVSADGKRLASGGGDRSVGFWNLESGKPCFENKGMLLPVASVAASDKGDLAALYSDGVVERWAIASGQPKARVEGAASVACVAYGADGRLAVGRSDGQIDILGATSKAKTVSWKAHDRFVRLVTFSPDGARLASTESTDRVVKIWDSKSGEPVAYITEAVLTGSVEAIAFHPSQPLLAIASIDWLGGKDAEGLINIWNYSSLKLVRSLPGGASRVAFSADGASLASVGLYETVSLYNVETGGLIRELAGRDYSVNAIAFDPQGRFLASGSDDFGLRLWDVQDWSLVCAFDLETGIKDLAFTADGAGVVTGNGNSTCYLVDLDSLA